MVNENPNKRDLNSESRFGKMNANAQLSPSSAEGDKGGGLPFSKSKSTNSQESKTTQSKLAHFPIMLFASVMGIGGLSLAFKKASVAFGANADFVDSSVNLAHNQMQNQAQNLTSFSEIFECASVGFASMGIFALLLGIYGLKIATHFAQFRAEATHQVKINFLSAIPIGALIIITFLGAFNGRESVLFALQIAFYVSAFLQLFLSVFVINFWFGNAMKRHLLSPAWFIPIVGNLIVPLAGHSAKINPEFSLLFFAIGCFFWLILTALITSRLIFEESLESKFLPTLFIFIAPPSIFVVDFVALFGGHSALSLVAYFVALFFMLLMLSLSKVFTRLNFALSWWAFTFPLCAFSIASFEVFVGFGTPLYALFGLFGLILSTFAVLFVAYKTLVAMSKGKICIAE